MYPAIRNIWLNICEEVNMAKTRTRSWNPVDRLTTPQYIVGYLKAVIEDD